MPNVDIPVLHQQVMHGMYGSYEASHRRDGAALLQWLSLQGLQDSGGHHLHTYTRTHTLFQHAVSRPDLALPHF